MEGFAALAVTAGLLAETQINKKGGLSAAFSFGANPNQRE
jgi:hypothetical protein